MRWYFASGDHQYGRPVWQTYFHSKISRSMMFKAASCSRPASLTSALVSDDPSILRFEPLLMQDKERSRALAFCFGAMYRTWLFSDPYASEVSVDCEYPLRDLRAAWRRRRKSFEKSVMLGFLRRDAGRSNDLSGASSQLLMVIKENIGMMGRWLGGPVVALGIVSKHNEGRKPIF